MVQSDFTQLTEDEIEEFRTIFSSFVEDLTNNGEMRDMTKTLKWMEAVLEYNVPHGKNLRGLMVAMTFKSIVNSPSEDEMRLAYVLGWCIEIFRASLVIPDDIIRNKSKSDTLGKPCWHQVDNMGELALNDSLLLQHTVYQLLKIHFGDKSCYIKLVDLFLATSYKTFLGHSVDLKTDKQKLDDYSLERYTSIVKYKTSYYSVYLPVALTMEMLGMAKVESWLEETLEKITFRIGHYLQVQEDYLNCYGNVDNGDGGGRDIQDCKCTWLFVTAREKCSPEQWTRLQKNYGESGDDNVDEVKKVYEEVDIPGEYREYEEKTFESISEQVAGIGSRSGVPETVFVNMLNFIRRWSRVDGRVH